MGPASPDALADERDVEATAMLPEVFAVMFSSLVCIVMAEVSWSRSPESESPELPATTG